MLYSFKQKVINVLISYGIPLIVLIVYYWGKIDNKLPTLAMFGLSVILIGTIISFDKYFMKRQLDLITIRWHFFKSLIIYIPIMTFLFNVETTAKKMLVGIAILGICRIVAHMSDERYFKKTTSN